jgi:hypothetical protein
MQSIGQPNGDKSAEDLKDAGDSACREGRYEDAISKYRAALNQIAIISENKHAHGTEARSANRSVLLQSRLLTNLSLCHLNVGEASEALAVAMNALSLRPRWSKAHVRAAGAYLSLGQHQNALDAYERAAQLDEGWLTASSSAGSILDPALKDAARSLSLCFGAVMDSKERCQAYDACLISWGESWAVAVACSDGTIRVWIHQTSQTRVEILKGHTAAVTTLKISPDGKYLASGSLDATARLWTLSQISDKNCLSEVSRVVSLRGHTSRVSAVEFLSTDSSSRLQRLTTASTDHTVRLWEVSDSFVLAEGARCLAVLAVHTDLVSSIAVSPCSKILAVASGDTKFSVWQLESLETNVKSIAEVAWDSGPVIFCGFLPPPAPPLLLTVHAHLSRKEARVLIWDVVEAKQGWIDGRLTSPIVSMDCLRGRPIAWDAAPLYTGQSCNSIAIAVLMSDGSGGVWELNFYEVNAQQGKSGGTTSKLCTQIFSFSPSILFNTSPSPAISTSPSAFMQTPKGTVAFSKGARFLAISCSWVHPPHIEVWEVQGDGCRVLRFANSLSDSDPVRTLFWKDQTLVSLGMGGKVGVWRIG